jgi:hypothetical protein
MFKITPQMVNRFSLAEILLILAINRMEIKRAAPERVCENQQEACHARKRREQTSHKQA